MKPYKINQRLKQCVALLAFSCLATSLQAQELTSLEQIGKNKYDYTCAPCHDPGPGSDGAALRPAPAALTIKYSGSLSPYITKRTDLANPDVLKVWVRGGTVSMPPFRKTEVSDDDIKAMAAYFAVSTAVE